MFLEYVPCTNPIIQKHKHTYSTFHKSDEEFRFGSILH